MPQMIRDLMAKDVITLEAGATVREAARLMRDKDTGSIIVTRSEQLKGILTDRDIAVRAVAEGRDPDEVTVGEISTDSVATVPPDATVDDAINILREKKVRRVPVVDGGVGRHGGHAVRRDLADRHLILERDENSALAEISAAAPNN
jgi:CBS domain-containing protein